MSEPIRMTLPADREKLAELRIGQEVRLTGAVFTSRAAGHERMLAALRETGELPFGLAGETIFYAGPTPAAAGRPLGSVGPTTASRMDFATPEHAAFERELLDAINATGIGPGALGGKTTALAVHLETAPCHIAALPVAVNMGCSAMRSASIDLLSWED